MGIRREREFGKVQPGIPMGPLTLRLPFIHYRFEWADYLQGLLMCSVCLGIIPILMDTLGMSFEVALAIVILNGTLYLAHVTFGDPVVPGWITPAIPLIIVYVEGFNIGPERMQALIAFQMLFGFFCIFLGITGLAKKFISLIPNAVQSAVLLGAGFAAIILIFRPGTSNRSFDTIPWTITICIGVAFYLLFSESFKSFKKKHRWAYYLGNLGMMPALALAIFVGPMVGEIAWPDYTGIGLFSNPDFATMIRDFTMLGAVPPPSLDMFLSSLPLVFSAYIVVFGDVIQSQALLDDSQKYRPDEDVNYNPNRSHIIFGGRNVFMSFFGPDVSMCGPLWAAMQVVVCERYKNGPKAMESINSGAGSFRWGTWTGYFLAPVVATVKPILGVALASTMLIQGYVSVHVGILKSRGFNDLGIAGVAGAVLATRGAAWGLGAALVLVVLQYAGEAWKKAYTAEEAVFPLNFPEAIQRAVEENVGVIASRTKPKK